ncbi:MAG: hypothetical protein R3C99_11795 [Pirellulaceae bacterium]
MNVSAGSLYLYDKKAADELKALADEAAKVRATKPKESFIRALTEPLDKAPPVSQLFYRGDHEQPKQEVMPALTVLAPIISRRRFRQTIPNCRRPAGVWLTRGG